MHLESRTAPTVLVVDDDADMRKLLRDVLQPNGYDVVVLDKEMPGMSGLDVLTVLHRRRPGLPVIFVTAFGGPDVAAESLSRGALEYVEKPFRLRRIVDTIRRVTDGRR